MSRNKYGPETDHRKDLPHPQKHEMKGTLSTRTHLTWQDVQLTRGHLVWTPVLNTCKPRHPSSTALSPEAAGSKG